MVNITNAIRFLTQLNKWIASLTMLAITLFIAFSVISRAIGHPVLGDVELVSTLMVVAIMSGLAYTQYQNKHISVGLLVDRFPLKIQLVFDVIANLLLAVVAWVITYVFVAAALNDLSKNFTIATELLRIPHYPVKFMIAIGFLLWGLEAFLKLIQSVIRFMKGDVNGGGEVKSEGDGDQPWL